MFPKLDLELHLTDSIFTVNSEDATTEPQSNAEFGYCLQTQPTNRSKPWKPPTKESLAHGSNVKLLSESHLS